ncbi:hypothetical protein KQX54_008782 [Cotesia glomerata]|uniref:Uncharacterized protein n=1 Tax=Cotesia glomerata TaxID=32391 RepID=A0AAV7HI65_COTGL|nr:hypothetical protein KQX54_008782 [Cotesia glomerata]
MRGTATAVEIEGMDDTEQTVLLFLLVVVRWYFENCCPLQMTKQATKEPKVPRFVDMIATSGWLLPTASLSAE